MITKALEDLFNTITDPRIILQECGKLLNDKDKEIQDLKIKLKAKQSRIDYLEGQISVYREFINSNEAEG